MKKYDLEEYDRESFAAFREGREYHTAGLAAYRECRSSGGERMDAVIAFFGAEPEAKARLLRRDLPFPWPVIAREEDRYLGLLKAWEKKLPKLYPDPSALTGEELAKLHHTHGLDPETVEALLKTTLSVEVKEDYRRCYAGHRRTGRAS